MPGISDLKEMEVAVGLEAGEGATVAMRARA